MIRSGKRSCPSVVLTICHLLIALILGWSVAGSARAATIHVPGDYSTIQKAVDAARRGDTVRVSQGTYYENVTLKEGVTLQGGWNKDFSKRDRSAHATVIDASKKGGSVVTGANGATLDGFTIINGTRIEKGDSTVGAGVYCKSTSPTIKNNIVRANAPAGIYCSGSSAVLVNNLVLNNEEAGIYLENGCRLKIKGNTIRGNKMAGIGTGGMVPSRMEVLNNIIDNNVRAGVEAKAATGTIYNNIIYETSRQGSDAS